MNRTLLLPLSACLLFASCVTTYSTSRKYVAVDTPEGETVVMNGDTLRYGLTPRDMALELGVEPSGKNLARMSRIVYAANSPQTAYGFYDATPEPLSVEIHAADTTYSYRLAAYNSDLFWLNFLAPPTACWMWTAWFITSAAWNTTWRKRKGAFWPPDSRRCWRAAWEKAFNVLRTIDGNTGCSIEILRNL